MTNPAKGAFTRTARLIRAPCEALYRAFLDPAAVAVWLAPGEMTGVIHHFDARVGGEYSMSLLHPPSGKVFSGKAAGGEDRFTARFVELVPPTRIIQAVSFDSADPALAGEMTMAVTFEPADGGTEVTVVCHDIPPGIRPEETDAGCRTALEKLARFVE